MRSVGGEEVIAHIGERVLDRLVEPLVARVASGVTLVAQLVPEALVDAHQQRTVGVRVAQVGARAQLELLELDAQYATHGRLVHAGAQATIVLRIGHDAQLAPRLFASRIERLLAVVETTSKMFN